MLFFVILSGLAFTRAVALPTARDNKAGHLTYGDVQFDLKTGCQTVPQNKGDNVPKPTNLFTKLQVDTGYTCELHHAPECDEDSFIKVNGPGQKAEYVSSWLFSVSCTNFSNDLSTLSQRTDYAPLGDVPGQCGALTYDDGRVPVDVALCKALPQKIPIPSMISLALPSQLLRNCDCNFYMEDNCEGDSIVFSVDGPKYITDQLSSYSCATPFDA